MKALAFVFPFLLLVLSETSVTPESLQQEPNAIFRLHTKTISGIEIVDNNPQIPDPKAPLIVITPGWNVSVNHKQVTCLVDAFLEKGDHNIITVDWLAMQDSQNNFITSSKIPIVAMSVKNLLIQLSDKANVDLQEAHLIGHSYGAHIMGYAARGLADKYRVGRITGLDPASNISLAYDEVHLTLGDANLVVVIHTSSIGSSWEIGDIDFFVNNGTDQPGCSVWDPRCSHNMVNRYYQEAVRNDKAFLAERCDGGLDEKPITIGGDLSKSDAGKYCVETNDEEPFSKSG